MDDLLLVTHVAILIVKKGTQSEAMWDEMATVLEDFLFADRLCFLLLLHLMLCSIHVAALCHSLMRLNKHLKILMLR